MYLTLIVLLLLVSILSGLFDRKVGVNRFHLIAYLPILLSTVIAIIPFIEGFSNTSVYYYMYKYLYLVLSLFCELNLIDYVIILGFPVFFYYIFLTLGLLS